MATIDRNANRTTIWDETERGSVYPRYPEDQIDFGYEISTSIVSAAGRKRGPEGLSLVARVYE